MLHPFLDAWARALLDCTIKHEQGGACGRLALTTLIVPRAQRGSVDLVQDTATGKWRADRAHRPECVSVGGWRRFKRARCKQVVIRRVCAWG